MLSCWRWWSTTLLLWQPPVGSYVSIQQTDLQKRLCVGTIFPNITLHLSPWKESAMSHGSSVSQLFVFRLPFKLDLKIFSGQWKSMHFLQNCVTKETWLNCECSTRFSVVACEQSACEPYWRDFTNKGFAKKVQIRWEVDYSQSVLLGAYIWKIYEMEFREEHLWEAILYIFLFFINTAYTILRAALKLCNSSSCVNLW